MKVFRLDEVLKEKGVTGKSLAKAVGLSPTSVSSLVKGDTIPRTTVLIKIANHLNVDLRDLFHSTKQGEILPLYYKTNEGEIKPLGELHLKNKVLE